MNIRDLLEIFEQFHTFRRWWGRWKSAKRRYHRDGHLKGQATGYSTFIMARHKICPPNPR